MEWTNRGVNWVVYHIKGEHHGPNLIVMDWVQDMNLPYLPSVNFPIPMRTNLLLRKEKDGKEKIVRYFEEWWGNKQLNRETTFPLLGQVHENLRYFTGQFLQLLISKKIL